MFKIRVDTGGTFTDCRGRAEGEAEARLVKVLSSGRLRVSVCDWFSPQVARLQIPPSWNVGESFFTGFKVEAAGQTALILRFDLQENAIHLSRKLPPSPSLDLFTGEEAPVLGARLLTGTGLDGFFPELEFRLATTRGTNALLERKGAPVALFITKGFRDLLTLRDQRRPDLFALRHERPAPLAEQVIEVSERISADGTILNPLVRDENWDRQVGKLLDSGIRVAAVSLLHGWKNPAHETALRDHLLDLGFDHVSVSSELAPLIKLLPRTETAVTNAYLHPVMQSFLDHIAERVGENNRLLTMTSAGGLEPTASYQPKDSLLSGPAGGVAGAAAEAKKLGFTRILTFDMGGTSTDVARYDDGFLYHFEQVVGDARLLSPALKIETVASGGGSICQWKNDSLRVGPESAGADPGPACYGRGGPLTITDVNLLLGRIDPDNFGIPLTKENFREAEKAALTLQQEAGIQSESIEKEFLVGLIDIAVEQMADAIRTISIRDGADPTDFALLAFGGAGPLHACDIAGRLGISTILIPAEAGLLSAYGLDCANVERFVERQLNLPADDPTLEEKFSEADREAEELLQESGFEGRVVRHIMEARLSGQDATLSFYLRDSAKIADSYREQYEATFGYLPPREREIEVVSYRAIASTEEAQPCLVDDLTGSGYSPNPLGQRPVGLRPIKPDGFVNRNNLTEQQSVSGPATIQDPFSTFHLKQGWVATVASGGSLIAKRVEGEAEKISRPVEIERELFRHRFDHLVEEMGTMLQRSAISTNVKERADFSCALLDSEGELITSAPHIPVHLGALGICVRMVQETIELKPGDTVVTNHPAIGGSHLPDVTLITPVFSGENSEPLAYIANRAHHAEIGGITPGSMPPHAASLAEEGVVISPTLLIDGGNDCFSAIEKILTEAPFPTRNLRNNIADLNAQLAANRRGQSLFEDLLSEHGSEKVSHHMSMLKSQSLDALMHHLDVISFRHGEATEKLDDGTPISVSVSRNTEKLVIEFTGTAASHPSNLHATPAIVQSAILYVLRLWTQSEVPLNEGMLESVEIVLPTCFLNPEFSDDPNESPAVVGGNVETSQRLVDCLIRALGIQACSQGTMNNFLFGNESFGYYETICGGSGAGSGYNGTSGIHTHMTNTAITDPEIMESRYPIRLREFSIRSGSGGNGKWHGGDGVIREVEFLESLQVSLLTQHRNEKPFGEDGGEAGQCGRQILNGTQLPGSASFEANPGDVLRIETPGGGGSGAQHRTFNAQRSTLNAEHSS